MLGKTLQVIAFLVLILVGLASLFECLERIRVWKMSPPHERIGWRPPEPNGT